MKKAFFVMLVCCSAPLVAQEEPTAFISAGKGFPITSSEPWTLDLNGSVLGAYRLGPGVMAIAYFDYIRDSFGADYRGGSYFTASRRTYSLSTGLKLSFINPHKSASPYFLGAIGLSRITSSSDSVFEYTGGTGNLIVLRVNSGTTASFLAAGGVDVDIYRGITGFGEVRASAGFKSNVYDFLLMYRAGVGIAIY